MTHIILFLHIYRIIFIIYFSLSLIVAIGRLISGKEIKEYNNSLALIYWILFVFSWYY